MKLLFLMRHEGYFRNYESVLRMLAAAGHDIEVRFALKSSKIESNPGVGLLERSFLNVRVTLCDPIPGEPWGAVAKAARAVIDFLRYQHAAFRSAPRLRKRFEDKVPGPLRYVLRWLGLGRSESLRRSAVRALQAIDAAIPTRPSVDAYLRESQPDLVLLTPMADSWTPQLLDYLKSARRLGMRTMLCVASWDNLTNKGHIQLAPDRVLVWNEAQRREAVELHGLPPDGVVATGAQLFDGWFDRESSRSREAFCSRVGLRADRPFLLYTCSSSFIASEEGDFVANWLRELRGSEHAELREAGVLIRPHPAYPDPWRSTRLSAYDNVTVWPPAGAIPMDEASRADYFDSLYHCAALVGINTSAMLEAGIVGRPVHTVLDARFRETQEGTLHFSHLVQGGLMHIAGDMAEHHRMLAASLAGDAEQSARIRAFIGEFVRPNGLDRPATPIVVDAIEQLAAEPPPPPQRAPAWAPLFQLGVRPVASLLYRALGSGKRGADVSWRERLRSVVGPLLPRRIPGAKGAPMPREMRDALDRVKRIAASGKKIVVGPWVAEVGFELLYWIPFVRWAVGHHQIPRDRLVVVSRGGVRSWYGDLAAEYVDIFDFFTAEEFRQGNDRRIEAHGGAKHFQMHDFDHRIVSRVKEAIGVDDVELFHPELMFRLGRCFWRRTVSSAVIEACFQHAALPPLDRSTMDFTLPEAYVAVKFYFSLCFPDTEENRGFVADTIRLLSRRLPVVVLQTGLRVDDHLECEVRAMENVILLPPMPAARNLEIQTHVICNARAFVGTYGGFSYLAPMFGVPSVALYSHEERLLRVHLDVAQKAFRYLNHGEYERMVKQGRRREAPGIHGEGRRSSFIPLDIATLGPLGLLYPGSDVLEEVAR